jgi:hypothetical protein
MCSCGPIGRERADQVLLRVPISFKPRRGDVNPAVHSGEVPVALKAVIETCHEYRRESVRRMVCTVIRSSPNVYLLHFYSGYVTQIAARNFLHHREYGLAVSYATSAENWTWLGRIVDAVLAEYIKHGLFFFPHCCLYSRNYRTRSLCSISSRSCAVTARAASTSRCRRRVHPPAHVCGPLRRVSSTKNKR